MTVKRKRFIAGAKCPKCHVDDRIVLYQETNVSWIECVACGLKQREPDNPEDNMNKQKEITVKWPIRNKLS